MIFPSLHLVKNCDVFLCQVHVFERGVFVLVDVRNEEIIRTFKIVAKPGIDFYSAVKSLFYLVLW